MPRRHLLLALSACLAWVPAAYPAEHGAVVLAASRSNPVPVLSREDVTRLYMGERLEGNKSTLKPLELDIPPWAREAFYGKLLGRTPTQMRALWARLVFSGRGRPPRIVANIDAALRELDADSSLVVFLPAESAALANLRTLYVF